MQNEFCSFKTRRSPTCIYSTFTEFIFTTRFFSLATSLCVYYIHIHFMYLADALDVCPFLVLGGLRVMMVGMMMALIVMIIRFFFIIIII